MNPDLIQPFLNKFVQIEIEGYVISGKLCSFFSYYNCNVLLLWSKNGLILVKNFESLGEPNNV